MGFWDRFRKNRRPPEAPPEPASGERPFEDAFMEVQSGLVSLCLELTGDRADQFYLYDSIEGGAQGAALSFNAFVEAGGRVLTLQQLDLDEDRVWQFLRLGTGDLQKLRDICGRYGQPVPTELKLVYDVRSGRFSSRYQYQPVLGPDKGVPDVLQAWIEEVRSTKTP